MASDRFFYQDQSILALTASFVSMPFGAGMDEVFVSNDDVGGTNQVVVSFDGGSTTHMVLSPGQYFVWGRIKKAPQVWLKYVTGAPNYRLEAHQNY